MSQSIQLDFKKLVKITNLLYCILVYISLKIRLSIRCKTLSIFYPLWNLFRFSKQAWSWSIHVAFCVNLSRKMLGPYNRGCLAALRFFRGSRETRQPRFKINKNNKINCKLIFGSWSSYIPAVKNALSVFQIFLTWNRVLISVYNLLACQKLSVNTTRIYNRLTIYPNR